jgi:hypothetical protein
MFKVIATTADTAIPKTSIVHMQVLFLRATESRMKQILQRMCNSNMEVRMQAC